MDGELTIGFSQQTKSTSRSSSVATQATLRLSRSHFALTSFALCFLQAAIAFSSSGRSLRRTAQFGEFAQAAAGAESPFGDLPY